MTRREPWGADVVAGMERVDVPSWVERYIRLLLRLEGISTPAGSVPDREDPCSQSR